MAIDSRSASKEYMMVKKSQKPSSKRVHVISRNKDWAIKKEGNSKASRVYKEKRSAVDGAKKLIRDGYDIVVHRRDGSIQKWEKSER